MVANISLADHPPPPPDTMGQKVKNAFFSEHGQSMVMLHIKLKGITNTATL